MAAIETVADLHKLSKRDNAFKRVALGDAKFVREEDTVFLQDGDAMYAMHEEGETAAGRFFGIPEQFLPKVSSVLQRDIFEYFRKERIDGEVAVEVGSGNQVLGMWSAERPMIPRASVAEVIARVMPAEAQVRRLDLTQGQLSVDITSVERKIEPRVGDFSEGGARVYCHVSPSRGHKQQPRVSSFWHRYVCANGMTRIEEIGKVSLHASTVDDIIEEMERALTEVWEHVIPERLTQFEHLLDIEIKDRTQMLHRLCQEHGIGEKIQTIAIGRLSEIQGTTLYDLVNLINEIQHEEGVKGVQYERLQELVGDLSVRYDRKRCTKCLTALD